MLHTARKFCSTIVGFEICSKVFLSVFRKPEGTKLFFSESLFIGANTLKRWSPNSIFEFLNEFIKTAYLGLKSFLYKILFGPVSVENLPKNCKNFRIEWFLLSWKVNSKGYNFLAFVKFRFLIGLARKNSILKWIVVTLQLYMA